MPNQGYAESARSIRIWAFEGPLPYSRVDNCVSAEELRFAGEACANPESRLRRKARFIACGSTLMVGAACLAVVVCKIGWTTFRSEHAESVQLDAVEKCHTAEPGDSCHYDIEYAQSRYLNDHPDWYPGLNVNSSFKDIQYFLHHQKDGHGKARCPRPCGYNLATEKSKTSIHAPEHCHTARGGESCYTHVKYTSKQIPQHPDWYLGLTVDSTFKEVQEYLSRQVTDTGAVCPRPCGPLRGRPHHQQKNATKKEMCRTALQGDRCYNAVKWVRHTGWKSHPGWFKGITVKSSPDDVQDFLSKHKGSHCSLPPCRCTDVRAGSECYSHVAFTLKELPEHPNWYPGLGTKSSFKEVQAYLHEEIDKGGRVCPKPCGLHAHSSAADVPATAASTEGLGASEDAGEAASQPKPGSNHNHSHGSDCHTARAGESCYDQVLWAMHAVNLRPEWYMGLSNKSRFVDFQEFLHRGRKDDEGKRCPRPCRLSAVTSLQSAKACHTAVQGEPCWNDVTRIHNEVLDQSKSHAGVSPSSTFEDIQLMLSKQADSHCDHMPCPCHTATEGEECFRHVEWVRTEGIKKHPARFAGLTSESAVEEIQYRLHPVAADHCLLPCAAPWHESQSQLI
mmetsp:Transcript_105047/g.208833  ORF Transcript_105047/g.208833 Transcript_105047/m.208833 type:complete len:620 (-) Transcript_105047:40-1899(-)